MRNNPQFVRVFAEFGQVLTDLHESPLRSLENYVCAIYGLPNVSNVNRLRSLIFQSRFGARLPRIMSTESATGIDLSRLPPCRASLLKHCVRSSYQAFIWKHALVAFCPVPSPDGCGWTVSDNDIQVDWISLSDIMRVKWQGHVHC